jgi:hypothetical protein
MAYQAENLEKFGKEQLEAVTSSSSSLVKGWQSIASESAEYSKKSLETGSVFLEKLLGAKTVEGAIKVQLEFAKTYYDSHLAFVSKVGELYSNLVKDALAPVNTAITKVQASRD